MEDFGWIVILGVFWLLSSIGEWRKAQRKRHRNQKAEDAGDERQVRTGPAAGRRDLAADVAEGERRAEEALRRWEARQRAVPRTATRTERPSDRWREAGERIAGTVGGARREAGGERREAYRSVADLLAARVEPREPVTGGEEGRLVVRPPAPSPPARPTAAQATSAMPIARPAPTGRAEVASPTGRNASAGQGLQKLDRLPVLQRAIVLRDLLGPPKALSPDPDSRW